jgi:dTDP-4-amino-4,6-dideoxygalactose transaminase
MGKIKIFELSQQIKDLESEILSSFKNVLDSSAFIAGKEVFDLEKTLQDTLLVKNCITCANGTDALQAALMALELHPGDEVILPAFTYIAPLEATLLLGLKPILADVNYDSFNN